MEFSSRIENRPVQYISFHDLKDIGIEVIVKEFDKELDNGQTKTAVKVVEVLRNGKPFPRHYMMEFLWILGIDTRNQKFWVRPKQPHRALTTKDRVYDYRYMGYERLDKEWIRSGRASEEAIALSSRMSDMGDHLNQMKNGGERDE